MGKTKKANFIKGLWKWITFIISNKKKINHNYNKIYFLYIFILSYATIIYNNNNLYNCNLFQKHDKLYNLYKYNIKIVRIS